MSSDAANCVGVVRHYRSLDNPHRGMENKLGSSLMAEKIVPVLHVSNARETAKWYARLGFRLEGEHQFAAGMPLYVFLERGENRLHLSEHMGDARPDTLVYFYVDDVDEIAREFEDEVREQPWGMREVWLTDPDGNRLRVGAPGAKDQAR